MKAIISVFTLFSLINFYGCNRQEEEATRDDLTIEREEEYDRDDTMEKNRPLPVETDDEIELDRDVLEEDEIDFRN
jgi:hypothetical protein